MKMYVTERVVDSEMWSLILEDWLRINQEIQLKHGSMNKDYQDILDPKKH